MKNRELISVFSAESFVVRESPSDSVDGYFDQALLDCFSSAKLPTLYAFGFAPAPNNLSPSLGFLHGLSQTFAQSLAGDGDIELSRNAKTISEDDALALLHAAPFALGAEHITTSWILRRWDELSQIFREEISSYTGTVADYLRAKNSSLTIAGRVFFHLVESRDEDYPFAFLATYSTGIGQRINHLPLKNALAEYADDRDRLLFLLKTVGDACDKSTFLSTLSESGELFSPLHFTKEEAYTFLTEVPLYEQSGIVCRIPNWWKQKSGAVVQASVGEKAPAQLGMDALLSFDAELYLDELKLTRAEAETLLQETSGLNFLKGKWVEVDHDKLSAALAAFDRIGALEDVSFAEAMRLQLGLSTAPGQAANGIVSVKNGTWLKDFTTRIKNPAAVSPLSVGEAFHATLRPYQQAGLNWLGLMRTLGFGALLADDMGLGKTVQILALLEYMREHGGGKTLLVIPASLICNWQSEAQRFVPKLRLSVIHAGNRTLALTDADLFITTYGMISRVPALSETDWDLIVLDEAQAIKNAGTKQTKSVKLLRGNAKIAMTGTPIENRLSDLWSLFDFLDGGLLGTGKEFTAFTKRLHEHADGYGRLREIVSPFILRRLKTDRSVIADLPDKVEIKEKIGLTKKQLVLYKSLVRELEGALINAEGIARKGLVISSIIKFKQICNHPDQYLGQNTFNPTQSGKFEKLAEICETIAEKQERVLVFTQFRELTEPLSAFLADLFGKKGLVLHGGTPVKKRGELVAHFNSEDYIPYMVLSLKAGGVGLNLSAANHVIHFDRWWNPAVENQATDRAFRIGQQKNVMVHKFVTAGTLEEKIDKMIEDKLQLSQDIISDSGEQWITELDNIELLQLFRLEV